MFIFLKQRNCSPFFPIRDKSTRICDNFDLPYQMSLEDNIIFNTEQIWEENCNCFPECKQYEYIVDSVQGKFIDIEM
jgi:hypothetical protein